jgi:hypothetical protein
VPAIALAATAGMGHSKAIPEKKLIIADLAYSGHLNRNRCEIRFD